MQIRTSVHAHLHQLAGASWLVLWMIVCDRAQGPAHTAGSHFSQHLPATQRSHATGLLGLMTGCVLLAHLTLTQGSWLRSCIWLRSHAEDGLMAASRYRVREVTRALGREKAGDMPGQSLVVQCCNCNARSALAHGPFGARASRLQEWVLRCCAVLASATSGCGTTTHIELTLAARM